MEHLNLPHDHDPVIVSTPLEYIGDDYDYGDFNTYPQRRGFDVSSNTFKGQEIDKDAAIRFYQTWCFTGMLHLVLDITDPSDFIIPHETCGKVVSTAKLKEYIWAHKAKLFEMSLADRIDWIARVNTSIAKYGNDSFGEMPVANEMKRVWTSDNPLYNRVQLSIALLGEALVQYQLWIAMLENKAQNDAKTKGWVDLDMTIPIWRGGNLPDKVFQAKGWCPAERERAVWEQPSVNVYLASMQVKRVREAHAKCTKTACVADTIDEKVYKTKHVTEGCDCEFIGPDVQEVMDALGKGKLPTIRIDIVDGDFISKMECEAVDIRKMDDLEEGGDEFIGLSHVWSDGLGNVSENKLPRCQVLRIARLCQNVGEMQKPKEYPEYMTPMQRLSLRFGSKKSKPKPEDAKYGTSVRIWMDTLCVPLEDNFRKIAIHTMDRVYQQAKAILVLDRQLLAYPYTTDEEAICRVYLCGWMRRVWTFQEAILGGSRIVYQFADCSMQELTIQERLETKLQELTGPILSTLTMFTFALDSDGFLMLRAWYKELDYRSSTDIKLERKFKGAIDFTKQITGYNNYGFKQRYQILSMLWEAMERRATTKEEDRAIIASTLLKLDTAFLLAQKRSERMPSLYQLLVEVPAYVLMGTAPRLQQEPFHWAPAAFVEGAWGKGVPKKNKHTGLVSNKGLSVKFDGYIIRGDLNAFYPESHFYFLLNAISYSVLLVRSEDTNQTIDNETWSNFKSRSPNGFAIIVSDQAPFTFESVNKTGNVDTYNIFYGCAISIKEEKKGVITGRFECLARVGEITSIKESKEISAGLEKEEGKNVTYVEGQEWLIT